MRRAALSADVCHTCWKTSDSWKMTTFMARYSLHRPINRTVSHAEPTSNQIKNKKTRART